MDLDKMRLLGRMRSVCVCILFACLLMMPIARASSVRPVIHSIPLQNETLVPVEYRNLPLVAKCCPVNEILVKPGETAVCVPARNTSTVNFSPLFNDFNRTGVIVPGDEFKEFVAIIGSRCDQKYMLEPETNTYDQYYLLSNGSIFAPQIDRTPVMLMPGEDYCMEIVPTLGLKAFVCFTEDSAVPSGDVRITIYACGLLISVPFLILTIVAYAITPRLRDVHGKTLCHYCGCLALAFTTLAIAQLASSKLPPDVCFSVAFVIQFSFLACFFWLNVMCIETWSLVHHHVNHSCRKIQPKTLFFYYSIWAWGTPAILILISMTMDLKPTIPMTYAKSALGRGSWFESDEEAMLYFYIPVSLLLVHNTILFVIAAVKISRYQQELALRRRARNHHSEDQRLFRRLTRTFIVCLVLFFLMGLNWTIELISWWAGGDPLEWSAFDLVNALQGVVIFGLFVLRRPIRDFVWHRIQKIRGIHTAEPDVGSMDLALLPVLNGDSLPGQTIIQ